MYKIWINERPLTLVQIAQLDTQSIDVTKNLLVRYNGKARSLLNPIDMMEKTRRYDSITIYAEDYGQLVQDFNSLYKIIEAAGGVVYNENGEILVMYRRDYWDLPKGKIDKGETKAAAALREVEEETGLSQVERGDLICTTYHTYRDKKKRILKRTYWYKMTTNEKQVTPQTEEDIEKLLWIKPQDFLREKKPIYNSIRVVVEAAILDAG